MKNWIIKLLGGYTKREWEEKNSWLKIFKEENKELRDKLSPKEDK